MAHRKKLLIGFKTRGTIAESNPRFVLPPGKRAYEERYQSFETGGWKSWRIVSRGEPQLPVGKCLLLTPDEAAWMSQALKDSRYTIRPIFTKGSLKNGENPDHVFWQGDNRVIPLGSYPGFAFINKNDRTLEARLPANQKSMPEPGMIPFTICPYSDGKTIQYEMDMGEPITEVYPTERTFNRALRNAGLRRKFRAALAQEGRHERQIRHTLRRMRKNVAGSQFG